MKEAICTATKSIPTSSGVEHAMLTPSAFRHWSCDNTALCTLMEESSSDLELCCYFTPCRKLLLLLGVKPLPQL